MEFKDVFQQLRISKGLNQAELAKELNLSRSSISMYETGERNPSFEGLELIADYFNVDIDYLTGRTMKTTQLPNLESNALQLSSFEEQIVLAYRKADDVDKTIVLRALHLDSEFRTTGAKEESA